MQQKQGHAPLTAPESKEGIYNQPYPRNKPHIANIQKLSGLLRSAEKTASLSVDELEKLTFQCIIEACQNNDYALAKNLAASVLTVLGKSKKISILLRQIILDDCAPGSTGKKELGAPLVSVVTPLYNQGKYLQETVQSVLNQNYANWEMIIVNDGSTDNSLEIAQNILKKADDPRIRLLTHENHGKGYTRNRGVREASGKYICVLDSDDQVAPAYFEQATNMLENSLNYGWVTPKTLVYGEGCHLTWDWVSENHHGLDRCISPCSALYRREIWENLGGYLEDMTDREDWEFWIRAWEHGWKSTTATEEVLFIYRHVFDRFGTRPQINVQSKLEIIQLHPWWFKNLSPEKRVSESLRHEIGRFDESILNKAYLKIASQIHSNKILLKKFMTWLKANWQKPFNSQDESSNQLRLALHYLAAGKTEKANKYIALSDAGNIKNWQRELKEIMREAAVT